MTQDIRPTGDESKLSMHFEAGGAAGEQAGAQIGPYKLLELIGEGGFGSVWMAEQREPVRRRVALKLIKLGMDTKQVIARFEAERQALAMMDHPNIAKVLDAGSTEAGRPYFVMEYIRGIPILAYCDQERLDTRARLELFMSVCHAIQHAHQKGIIHRDIKPSNVLVTLHDGVAVPKVIDFGVAKATNSELTTKTLFTEHRQMIGTPAYMSPEQAEMSGLDIDTRSDIYSLGVLLYEILTGTTPFDVYDLVAKGYEEMMRIIREEEPHKPSTRISSLGETSTRTAQQRRADVKTLGSLLRGDLDWIVMKCLEKDRSRRYETANGLAADIKRHLNDEPVTARAPSAGYKLQKFVRRNRGQVIAGCALAATLLIGVIAFAWQAKEARDQRDLAVEAKEAEAEQRKVADAAKGKAEEQEARAKEQEAEAKKQESEARKQEAEAKKQAAIAEAVARFQTDMLAAADPQKLLGDKVTVLQAMQAAIAELDKGSLKDQPLVEARVRGTIGVTLHGLARYDDAEPILRKALEIRRAALPAGHVDISTALNNLATVLDSQGKPARAEPLYREAIEIARAALPAGDRRMTGFLSDLGLLLQNQNKLSEAEPILREALEISRAAFPEGHRRVAISLNNFALLRLAQNKVAEAEPLLREALEIDLAVLPAGHPGIAIALDNLAKVLRAQNKFAEGESLMRKALEIRRAVYPAGHPNIAMGVHNLATLLKDQNKLTEAEPLFREAVEIERAARHSGYPGPSTALESLADLLESQNKLAEAEALYREALDVDRAVLPAGHPKIAMSLRSRASLLANQTKFTEAEPLLREALAMIRAALPAGHPEIGVTLNDLGEALSFQNKLTEAETIYREALGILRAAYPAGHLNVARTLYNLAALLESQNKLAEAEALYREALGIDRAALPAGHPDIAMVLSNLASLLNDQNKLTEAEPLFRESLEIYRAARPAGHPNIAVSLNNLAMVLKAQNKFAEAEPLCREALAIARAAHPAAPPDIADSCNNLALVLKAQNKLAEAEPLFREAVEIGRAAFPARHPTLLTFAANLVNLYVQQGKTQQAISLAGETLEWSRAGLSKDSPELAAQLATFGRALLNLKGWDAAEPIFRECLAIREKAEPDAWRTFNTRSMLGAVLLGQKKLAEAEPLLLAGYRGMKEREASIPQEAKVLFIPEALGRLVQLYEATGNAAEAAAWTSKLEAARLAESKPAAPGDK